MKHIKRILIISIIVLFFICVFDDYKNNSFSFNSFLDKVLARANDSDLLDITGLGDLVSDKDTKSLKDSGISGSDVSINATYYPYYGMLNDNEKAIYKQVYANVNKLENTFIPVVDIDEKGLKNAVMAVFYDHPELFWLDNDYAYKYTKSGKCVQIIMKFNSTVNDIDEAKKRFDNEANKIISGASKYNSAYDKEKYVHDAIINNTVFDANAKLNQSAYSALVNKKSVCAGYARSFQYIMIKLGIPTYYVVGIAKDNHAWNIVALSDGYYNVDVTWDAQEKIIYNFFNRTDKEFAKTHTRNDLSVNLPSCNATGYIGIRSNNVVKTIIKKYTKIITNDDTSKVTDNKVIDNENNDKKIDDNNINVDDDKNDSNEIVSEDNDEDILDEDNNFEEEKNSD